MASEKLTQIVEELKTLTLLEVSDLVKELEIVFDVKASAPVGMIAAAPTEGPITEEQTEFTPTLTEIGAKKIEVIKVVRAITGLGLKEAKDLVDNAPKPIKENVSKEEAESIKSQLEEAGAKVEIK